MNPVNIIYIVLYLNSIQPSHVKNTLKQYIYFILLHYYILRCPSTILYDIVLYLHSIQSSNAKKNLKKTHKLYFILLHYFILRFHSKTHYEM